MEFADQGILLSSRRHGESGALVVLLTLGHGRHAGLLRGGAGRRWGPHLLPGGEFAATWRARLAEHLGTWSLEPSRGHAAALLDDPGRLAALSAACALAEIAVPEREPHPALYEGLKALLGALDELPSPDEWGELYVRWEIGLLKEVGFGLDLERCAVTGRTEGLSHVSPRTGRAVSAEAAAPYADRLLPLPPFLGGGPLADNQPYAAIRAGLALTGHFLAGHVLQPHRLAPPAARTRLVEFFAKAVTTSGV